MHAGQSVRKGPAKTSCLSVREVPEAHVCSQLLRIPALLFLSLPPFLCPHGVPSVTVILHLVVLMDASLILAMSIFFLLQ